MFADVVDPVRRKSRAVRFYAFGGPDVLRVMDVDPPVPGPGQIRLRVNAAGIEPFDIKSRRGDVAALARASLPRGLGSEASGVIDQLGAGVGSMAVGDEVLGKTSGPAHADYVLASAAAVVAKPPHMPWEEAGALAASGQTAHTALRLLNVRVGDTVLVHAAAGGVGTMAVQLAVAWGATVIGTASEHNHPYLRELGAIPVAYGAGLVNRVRSIADDVTVVLDAAGTDEALRASAELVKDHQRIGTIAADPAAATRLGVSQLTAEFTPRRLAELVELWTAGKLRVHIHRAFSLDDVANAHRELEARHVRGKVVLTT